MAFYCDRHSIFHVQARAQGGSGLSQFGRALRDLTIDSICGESTTHRVTICLFSAPRIAFSGIEESNDTKHPR